MSVTRDPDPRVPSGSRGARRRRSWPRRLLALAGLVLIVLLIAVGWGAWEAIGLRRELLRGRDELEAAVAVADPVLSTGESRTTAELRDVLNRATAHLVAADTAFSSAHQRTGRLRPVLWLGARLPGPAWLRGLDEVAPLVATAGDTTGAGLALARGADGVLNSVERGAGGRAPLRQRLVDGLAANEGLFREARSRIDRARARRATINATHLSGPLAPGRDALDLFDREIARVQPYLARLIDTPPSAWSLAGVDEVSTRRRPADAALATAAAKPRRARTRSGGRAS